MVTRPPSMFELIVSCGLTRFCWAAAGNAQAITAAINTRVYP
jgi:hypothetical protein